MYFFNFSKERVKIGIGLIVVLWISMYFANILSPSYRQAKKFIEQNDITAQTIGKVKAVILLPQGRTSSMKQNNLVTYKLFVFGEKETATAKLDLSKTTNGWEILRANLFLGDNAELNILKNDNQKEH
ncbi:MAG: hypothetical protein ACOYOK_01850 [Pseudobdellovibrionaceae bacterium]